MLARAVDKAYSVCESAASRDSQTLSRAYITNIDTFVHIR